MKTLIAIALASVTTFASAGNIASHHYLDRGAESSLPAQEQQRLAKFKRVRGVTDVRVLSLTPSVVNDAQITVTLPTGQYLTFTGSKTATSAPTSSEPIVMWRGATSAGDTLNIVFSGETASGLVRNQNGYEYRILHLSGNRHALMQVLPNVAYPSGGDDNDVVNPH